MEMVEAVGEVFPDAKYQTRPRYISFSMFFSVVPKSKVKIVAKMLKAIHTPKRSLHDKAKAPLPDCCAMKLKEAAKKVEDGIEETLIYCDFAQRALN